MRLPTVPAAAPFTTPAPYSTVGRDDAELRAITVGHDPWGAAWRRRDADVFGSPEFGRAPRNNGVVLVRWRDLRRAVR